MSVFQTSHAGYVVARNILTDLAAQEVLLRTGRKDFPINRSLMIKNNDKFVI